MSEELEELARKAIEYQTEIVEIAGKLDKVKDELRRIAGGTKQNIQIAGLGSVVIACPRVGGVLTGQKIEVDTKILDSNVELKNKLIEKKILRVVDVLSTPAAASITIKPNV